MSDITERPGLWQDALLVAQGESLTVLGEPDVELNRRVMARPWSEELIGELRCDGAFFGYEHRSETLHLVVFSKGSVEFAWSDSLLPGPSYAMIFDDQGRVTNRDPRRFALDRMGLPTTSPFLDRFRFVDIHLQKLGLEQIRPRLDNLAVTAAFDVCAAEAAADNTDS